MNDEYGGQLEETPADDVTAPVPDLDEAWVDEQVPPHEQFGGDNPPPPGDFPGEDAELGEAPPLPDGIDPDAQGDIGIPPVPPAPPLDLGDGDAPPPPHEQFAGDVPPPPPAGDATPLDEPPVPPDGDPGQGTDIGIPPVDLGTETDATGPGLHEGPDGALPPHEQGDTDAAGPGLHEGPDGALPPHEQGGVDPNALGNQDPTGRPPIDEPIDELGDGPGTDWEVDERTGMNMRNDDRGLVWQDATTGREYRVDPETGHLRWEDPDTGEVELRDTDTGDLVEPARTGLPGMPATDALDDLRVAIPVPEGQAEAVAREMAASLALDSLGAPQEVQDHVIELLTAAGQDGELTMWEAMLAFDEAMEWDRTESSVEELASQGEVVALAAIDPEEGPGAYRVRVDGDTVNLDSLRSGRGFSTDRASFDEAWKSAPVADLGAAAPLGEPIAAITEDEGGNGMGRTAVLAGATLLPLAGAGSYLAWKRRTR